MVNQTRSHERSDLQDRELRNAESCEDTRVAKDKSYLRGRLSSQYKFKTVSSAFRN